MVNERNSSLISNVLRDYALLVHTNKKTVYYLINILIKAQTLFEWQ